MMLSSCKCSRIEDFGMTPEGTVAGSTSAENISPWPRRIL
jgi:hypothetical protein